jgi:hypothetical protein
MEPIRVILNYMYLTGKPPKSVYHIFGPLFLGVKTKKNEELTQRITEESQRKSEKSNCDTDQPPP